MNLRIDLYIHNDAGLEGKVDQILASLAALRQQGVTEMADLSALQAEVANNTSVVGSAVTLIQNIKAQLDAAGTDPVALKALSDQLGANDKALADAVAANTPTAPTP